MSPHLLRETTPTARKPHVCGMCQGWIHPGETYSRETYLGDDGPYDWLTCAACDKDNITGLVFDWAWHRHHEGVTFDDAAEWAEDDCSDEASRWRLRARMETPEWVLDARDRVATS